MQGEGLGHRAGALGTAQTLQTPPTGQLGPLGSRVVREAYAAGHMSHCPHEACTRGCARERTLLTPGDTGGIRGGCP